MQRKDRVRDVNGSAVARITALLCGAVLLVGLTAARTGACQELPDSPGTLLVKASPVEPGAEPGIAESPDAVQAEAQRSKLPLCNTRLSAATARTTPLDQQQTPCRNENPNQSIVSSRVVTPLDARHKGLLAIHDVIDPFNLLTITGYSAVAIGSNAHSAFGPGWQGFGRLTGYSLLEDSQGEFFGTFLISSLAHEDPRYHRMPHAPIRRRILHALAHTWVSQGDDGRPMPNYSTLLTYPISAELSNLYVPGVQTNGISTVKRISIGLATDPSGTVIAEFLPDFARHIHVHVIFIQEILNQVITGGTAPNVQ